ncbi:hypothetical protein GN956_G24141 [Arapaima gigas]
MKCPALAEEGAGNGVISEPNLVCGVDVSDGGQKRTIFCVIDTKGDEVGTLYISAKDELISTDLDEEYFCLTAPRVLPRPLWVAMLTFEP